MKHTSIKLMRKRLRETYESVAFRFCSVLISDNDSFKNVSKLLKVFAHFLSWCLPS